MTNKANVISNNFTSQKKENEDKNNDKVFPLWYRKLDRYDNGKIKNNFNNFKNILENDEEFANKIMFNEFNYKPYILKNSKRIPISDNEITDILIKIEKKYDGINNRKILEQVVDLIAEKNSYNPIINYLNSLKWDGKPRLATAFSDYFGCEQSRYNEYCFRVFLNGAIARALSPRCKI